MLLKDLLTDDEAVSPVIGVILMVAITVILAAVIGAFVLNLGGGQASAPQASYSCGDNPSDGDNDANDLIHDGGDELEYDSLSTSGTLVGSSGTVYTAGDPIVNDFGDGTLTWENPNSDETNILADRDCS